MVVTDSVGDMLTRIRNAGKARHAAAEMPSSTLRVAIARVLAQEGYIAGYEVGKSGDFDVLRLKLKYQSNKEPVIRGLKRVSKPGRRMYSRRHALPRVLGGMGVAIVSTSKGVLTARDAAEAGVGGEVLGYVW